MSVTTPDDGLVRSHEEALALLRYTVLGAQVTVAPIARAKALDTMCRSARYEITLPGSAPHTDTYSLPCRAENLARRARTLADEARARAKASTTRES